MSIEQLQKCGKYTTILHASVNTFTKKYNFVYKYAAQLTFNGCTIHLLNKKPIPNFTAQFTLFSLNFMIKILRTIYMRMKMACCITIYLSVKVEHSISITG